MSSKKRRHGHAPPLFERISERVSQLVGSSWAFLAAAGIVVIWASLGPVFKYSDTWQLVINTGTTIITFLMVFVIQRSQNRATEAVALKLNEIVASIEGASNRLIDVEDLSQEEMRTLHEHYRELVKMSKKDKTLTESHSIEEAQSRHAQKQKAGG